MKIGIIKIRCVTSGLGSFRYFSYFALSRLETGLGMEHGDLTAPGISFGVWFTDFLTFYHHTCSTFHFLMSPWAFPLIGGS
jgi:hypothetical protein